MKIVIIKSIICYCLMFLLACSSKTYRPGEIPKAKISDAKMFEQQAKSLSEQLSQDGTKVTRKGKDYERVRKIMNKLLPSVALAKDTFPILILESEDINAAVYEGRTVVVNKGLLQVVENDDQLSAILSHELGHVLANHHNDTGEEERETVLEVGSTVLGVLTSALTTYYTGSSSVGDLAGNVTSSGTNMIGYGAYVRAYSRTQEYQADDIGLSIMTKSGYDPKEAIKLWKIMEEKNVGSGSSFYSTHPKSKDRAERIEERIPETIKSLRS